MSGKRGEALQQEIKNIRNVKNYSQGLNIINHAWTKDHIIDFENGKVIDKGNYRNRRTLESRHTALANETDNNSKPIPGQYAILLQKLLSAA